jgi:hypothetical protein
MPAYTSSQSGDFNNVATWGGGGYPSVAGDTFIVSAGHTVTYNVSSAVELGASSISGILTFLASMNTKLCFGNVTLTINSGGNLRIGTLSTPIAAAYKAELLFNTASDATNGVSCNSNGAYTLYGDTAFCSTKKATLANDAENTDGDVYIKTNEDMSAIWAVGQQLYIKTEKMGDSSSYTDAFKLATIVSVSGTTIEVDINITCDTGVGSTWVSTVFNITRNVQIGKIGASTVVGNINTNRPRWLDSNVANPNNNKIIEVQFTGFGRLQVVNAILDISYRNGQYCGYSGTSNNTISGCFLSLTSALYVYCHNNIINADFICCGNGLDSNSNDNTINGDFFACNNALQGSSKNNIKGNIIGCNYALYGSSYNKLSGCIIFCVVAFNNSLNNTMINGKLGYSPSDVSSPNTYESRGYNAQNTLLINCKFPLSGIGFFDKNTKGSFHRVICEHANQVLDAHAVFCSFGDVLKTPCNGSGTSPSVDPDGDSFDCLEVSNLQSNLGQTPYHIEIFNDYSYRIWATASVSKTYSFKLQSTFTTTLANTEISLEGEYLNSGTNGQVTTIASTGTIAARSSAADWSQSLSVTINPSQTGWVTLQLKLKKYESGKKIYVWPTVGIA